MSRGVGWWLGGVFKEGLWHLIGAGGMWLLLSWLFTPAVASVAVAAFWVGRELRDFEIEAGPNLWVAMGGDPDNWPLAPATEWTVGGLRHSLSGWFPVCVVMAILYVIFR